MSKNTNEGKRAATIARLGETIPYAAVIGLETARNEAGPLTVLRYRPSNIGNTQIPALHGGVVGALLEHAAIFHLLHAVEDDAFPKIVNISIDYLRPCRHLRPRHPGQAGPAHHQRARRGLAGRLRQARRRRPRPFSDALD